MKYDKVFDTKIHEKDLYIFKDGRILQNFLQKIIADKFS